MLKDWRGNEYEAGAPLDDARCSVPECEEIAVRHRCNAEGGSMRTHWHGQVHSLDGGGPAAYCDRHGRDVLQDNADKMASR